MKKAFITCLSLLAGFVAFAQPATQATNISFSTTTSSSITLSWTNGDGIARMVIAADASPVATPSNVTAYTANEFFGIGDPVAGGGGNSYVVYDGTGTTVTVTGLATFTTYYFQVFEYNAGPYFLIDPSAGNPNSTTTSCATAGSDFSFCGSPATLSGSGVNGGTGTWSVVSGSGSFVDPSDPGTDFIGTIGTSTTLAWTVTGGGCPGYDEVVVTLDPNPTIADAGDPQTACSGVTLGGNTPTIGNGYWSAAPAGGVFGDPTDPTTSFSGPPGTSYTLTWTISHGSCSPSVDNTTVTFETPVTSYAGTDQTVCGLTAFLGANSAAPGVGEWSIVSGPAGNFSNVNAEDASFDGELGATYTLRWTITNGSCGMNSDDVQIYFDTPAGMPDVTMICSGVGINYDLQNLINTLGNSVASDFSWTVAANPNVTGQSSGGGDFLVDAPVNVTGSNEILVYSVTPVSQMNLCSGDPFNVNVTVGAIPILSTTLHKTVDHEEPIEVTLIEEPGSVPATTFNINFVNPNGTTPGGLNAVIGTGYSSTAIYSDTYSNTINSQQVVQYNISPVSGMGCEGSAADVYVTINPVKILESDSLALVALYDATYDSAGTGWSFSNWLQGGTTVSMWNGVTVAGGRVTNLNLSFNNLTGTLPAAIGDLTGLEFLNLDGNNLTGPIPSEITNLTSLATLHMAQNDFSGSIPANIGNLVNLYGLALSDNKLSGVIPPSFANLSALNIASLSNNQLTGPIPSNIGDLLSITQLNLGNNKLSGTIPVSMGTLINLTDLSLNNNQLTGTVPASFDALTNLDYLDVSYNNLSGIFPDLPALTVLTDVYVNNNGFTSVPSFATNNVSNGDFSYNYLNFTVLEQIVTGAALMSDFSILAKGGGTGVTFGPQHPIPVGDTIAVSEGSPFAITYDAGGTGTTYQWIKNTNGPLPGETLATYDDTSAEPGDAGQYFIEATNATFPFTIITTPFTVEVYSTNSPEESGYAFLKKIGSETLGIEQNFPGRIVVDSKGDIYTIDNFARINKYNSAGGLIATINTIGSGEGKVACMSDLEIDNSDNLLISSECDNKILKYDPAGNFMLEIPLPGFQNSVYGIAVNASNEIYVAPRVETPYRILHFDSAGFLLEDIYISGGPVYQSYLDLELDAVGNLYLSDPGSQRIDKYLPSGSFDSYVDLAAVGFPFFAGWDFVFTTSGDLYLQSFAFAGSKIFHFGPALDFIGSFGDTYLANPIGITSTSEGILVGDEYAGITLFDEAGVFIKTIGPVKTAEGQFNDPQDIAIDSKGNRYIADKYNNRIQKFDAAGNFTTTFGVRGTGAGQFKHPVAIAIDRGDNIFVVDQGNSRIQKFTPNGVHMLSFGSSGAGDGQFSFPIDIALSIEGNILVADGGANARIQSFTIEGAFVSKFGAPGIGAGEFQDMKAMATMRTGEILVFDNNARLQRFDKDGAVISEVKLLGALNNQVNGMETDALGALYVAHGNGAIKKFDINGSLLTNVGVPAVVSAIPLDGQIQYGTAVSANADGDTLWIADSHVNRISIFVAQMKDLSDADSLALRDLYTATDGPNWNVNTNWLTSPIQNWHGVTISGGKVRSIVLPSNNLTGQLPASLSVLNDLRILNLSGNNLTGEIPDSYSLLTSLVHLDLSNNDLAGDVKFPSQIVEVDLSDNNFNKVGAAPLVLKYLDVTFNELDSLADLSATLIDSLKVEENNLTFEDLEPNITIPGFTYSPQDSVETKTTVLRELGVADTIKSTIGGSANVFKWFKDGVAVTGESLKWLIFESIAVEDDAIYNYEATSSIVPGLTLTSRSTEFKVSSLRRDSIALHALYLATNGAEWLNNENWITTPLSENNWHGVTISNNRVTAVELPENNLSGSIPSLLSDVRNLDTLDFANNEITSLATLTGLPNLASLDVSGNKLDFESLETNASIPGINYSNQDDIGSTSTVNLPVGESYIFELNVGGTQNHYQWRLNESNLPGDTLNTYSIEAIGRSSMGRYVCEITNSLVPDLILKTAVDTLYAVTNLSGTVFAEGSAPATSGNVMLLRVENEGGFDTTSVHTINEDGSYLFQGIILDDYQLVSFIDTIEYTGAIPTYYKNTIFWEEADTLFVNAPMDSLDIVTMYKPVEAPTGKGVISGYVVEDDGTPEGRVKKNKRVDNAGASVRKVERTGRGKEELLTLIAYQFTNADGEFVFTNLAEGEYRLNIQYPGYPMDENSFVTIPIGSGLNSEKRVEAIVEEGKIVVRELVITSVWTYEDYRMEMYPNPTSSFIQIEFLSESFLREVDIFDINGKKLISKKVPGKKESIDVRSLQKGHYLLNVQDKGMLVKTLQVIVE